ncbi:ABC transporter permease [Dokdonia pacifica]|uniref:Putative ABC transport system permease protein n=1 Tax=Dokdonia pacifica TaxID=1627892 RepID=A0A239CTU3_9FLAO|nr:ABC transporter permease [Dokdonia pacifica]GGG39332.1 ABC transporter permease [Dokdonia pacifica]SNS22783.1 putative ABC transport system permease protein [Dokdonia pacifica]
MFSLFRENFRISLDSIKSQLLRTILTVLIISLGIFALVGILTFIKAFENTLTNDFASIGSNTITIQRYEFSNQRRGERKIINPVIGYRDVKEFAETYSYPTAQTAISFTGTRNAEVKYESEKTDPEVRVVGVNENFLQNGGLKLDKGRNFTPFDISNNTRVCVLGSDFNKNLFKDDNPIGKTISIRGTKFSVIAILEEKGATFGNNQDLRVLIPIQVARTMFTQPNINYNVSVMVDDPEYLDSAEEEAVLTFRNIRKLSPVEENNFGIGRSDDLVNQIATITGALGIAAWAISLITIFGSCIALVNIMLVSVTERTREIGVRKALGAKKSTIAFQFLYEAIIIGQLGGALGIFLGIGVGLIIAISFDLVFTVPWNAIIAATTITFFIAVVSGLFPALKAAKLDPIESLRYE